jgi:hypothetical protein
VPCRRGMRWVYLAAPGTAASSVVGTFARAVLVACFVWAALATAADRGRDVGRGTASMSNGLQLADHLQA